MKKEVIIRINLKKFLRSIILIIGVIILILFLINKITYSHNEPNYKTITVYSGDTLWNIAKHEQETNDYYKNKDIRQVIQEIKDLNNMSESEIYNGQTLMIEQY